jgi:hypothetical protein
LKERKDETKENEEKGKTRSWKRKKMKRGLRRREIKRNRLFFVSCYDLGLKGDKQGLFFEGLQKHGKKTKEGRKANVWKPLNTTN